MARNKILIFAAEGLTKRSAVGFLLRSLIMFQTFISRHNSNFFSDKLVLTSVTPASSAPVLQTPKATSSTLYFDRDRKSGSAGMPRPISYAVFCLKKKKRLHNLLIGQVYQTNKLECYDEHTQVPD